MALFGSRMTVCLFEKQKEFNLKVVCCLFNGSYLFILFDLFWRGLRPQSWRDLLPSGQIQDTKVGTGDGWKWSEKCQSSKRNNVAWNPWWIDVLWVMTYDLCCGHGVSWGLQVQRQRLPRPGNLLLRSWRGSDLLPDVFRIAVSFGQTMDLMENQTFGQMIKWFQI